MNGYVVSITSQGQLTIPSAIRKSLGIKSQTKAVVAVKGKQLVVTPKDDFWSLGGSLRSPVSLSDSELQKARAAFQKQWPRPL